MKKAKIALAIGILIVLFAGIVNADSTGVNTFAGVGSGGHQNGVKNQATFTFPYGLALDADGGILVVDSYSNRVRKIKGDQVTTLSGTGEILDKDNFLKGGYLDGKISDAKYSKPRYAIADSKGNIYVSDTANNTIRKITSTQVYTLAGIGKAGYKDGSYKEAMFNGPSGLAVDSQDNIYVADTMNHVIRKITPKGDVSTYAGLYSENGGYSDGESKDARFCEPNDITIDKNDALYVSDSGNHTIRIIKDSKVTTLCGFAIRNSAGVEYAEGGFADGKGIQARFNYPKGICLAEDGILYVADTWNHCIRAVKPDGTVVTIAGNHEAGIHDGNPAEAKFSCPIDVLFVKGDLYISDMNNNRIRRLSIDQNVLKGIKPVASNYTTSLFNEKPSVWLNGRKVTFADVKPFNSKGATMVPIKSVCEAADAYVYYDAKNGVLTLKTGDVLKQYSVKKLNIEIKNNRICMPVRQLAELLNLKVQWLSEFQAILLNSK